MNIVSEYKHSLFNSCLHSNYSCLIVMGSQSFARWNKSCWSNIQARIWIFTWGININICFIGEVFFSLLKAAVLNSCSANIDVSRDPTQQWRGHISALSGIPLQQVTRFLAVNHPWARALMIKWLWKIVY